ncbi:MAG: 3-phosphoshikimate 1-carboxyvinyltransferase [Xanthomonadales bacterium PRO6]|nr:3-phosphoshikimate 1-carboxyvinyltransferase [Xanthomonadales bacterium]MCE7930540.1 3-phosphoshikimate 1-carboxyvinyltransferase [Xanthomonadales bacterium PRO6]
MSGSAVEYRLQPVSRVAGRISVPGDKSISHRAVMFGALARGRTEVSGFLPGEDTLHTAQILRQLGVAIERSAETSLRIDGVGLHGLRASAQVLDCGNAGTAMRLLAGLLSGQRFASTLVGDESLSRRPMRRVMDPLLRMGACIAGTQAGTAPLRIEPAENLRGIDYNCPVASAQIKSCVLLAGLYADGETAVTEPAATRDYTERMLAALGADVVVDGLAIRLRPGRELQAQPIFVPGDFSSAAFFLVAGAIAPTGEMLIENVGLNPRRTGLLDTLVEMGADIVVLDRREIAGEPVGDLRVRASALRGVDVPEARVPDMIDEFPAFAIAAACAAGRSSVRGAHELRVKESDRIAATARGLATLGVEVEEFEDGMAIEGRADFGGGQIDSRSDHRIAMAFAVASLRARSEIRILDCANVATSFPGFPKLAASVGLDIGVFA